MTVEKRNWALTIAGMVAFTALAFFIMGSVNVTGPRCASFIVDSAFDMYFEVGKNAPQMLDISFEPDQLGTRVDVDVELYFCSGTNPTAQGTDNQDNCIDFDFDTDGNGLGDWNILTGDATDQAPNAPGTNIIEFLGVRGISGFNYLRARATGAAPNANGEAVLTVCRRAI